MELKYSSTRPLYDYRELEDYGTAGPKLGKGAYASVRVRGKTAIKTIEITEASGLNPSAEKEIAILINLNQIQYCGDS